MNADIDQSQDGGSLNVDQTQFAAEGFMAGVNDNEQGSSDPVDALNQLIARSRGVNIDSSNPPKDSGMEGVKREIQKTTVSPQNLPDSTGPAASSSDWDNLFLGWRTDHKIAEEIASTLPVKDRALFMRWWGGFQETITWEAYKASGFVDPCRAGQKVQKNQVPAPSAPVSQPTPSNNAYLSTSLARTSPFYPVSRAIVKDQKQRIQNSKVEISNNWGETIIDGPLMTIPDEGVLLALTHISVEQKSNAIETTLSRICKLLGKSRGKNQYDAIRTSIIILGLNRVVTCLYKDVDTDHNVNNTEKKQQNTDVDLIINDINTHSKSPHNNQKQVQRVQVGSILFGEVDRDSSSIKITLNEFFLEQYRKGLSTTINLEEWNALRSDIAKALHRFISSHSEFKYPFSIMTLSKAINLNTNQNIKKVRELLNQAFAELERVGIAKCVLTKGDLIYITIL